MQCRGVNTGTKCSVYSQVLGLAVRRRQVLYFIVGIHKLEIELLEEQRDSHGSLLQRKLVSYVITDVSFWVRLVLKWLSIPTYAGPSSISERFKCILGELFQIVIKHPLGLELVCVGTKRVGVSVEARNQDHSGLAVLDNVFASDTNLAMAFRLRHQYEGRRWRLEAQSLP